VSASPSTVCTYSAGYITPKTSGVCTVALSQPGNAEFFPATSSSTRFAVLGATKATVTANDTTVTTSQDVTLSVTVSRVTASTQTMNGTARIYDGSTLLKTLTVPSSGKVSYLWTSRARGTHTVKVVYAGGTWFTASTSSTVKVSAS
jgi:hypothetical protein